MYEKKKEGVSKGPWQRKVRGQMNERLFKKKKKKNIVISSLLSVVAMAMAHKWVHGCTDAIKEPERLMHR